MEPPCKKRKARSSSWIQHTSGGRRFYRQRGDDGSITVQPPAEGWCATKEETGSNAGWFEGHWKSIQAQSTWVRHNSHSRTFYRKKGEDGSITVQPPAEGWCATKEETGSDAGWFEGHWKSIQKMSLVAAPPESHSVPSDVSLSARVKAARDLRAIYGQRFAFPAWSIEMLKESELEGCAAGVTVYHSVHDDGALVRSVATQREPCNIAMQRMYDQGLLSKSFGYKQGFYRNCTPTKLMPNIAVYCCTPFRCSEEGKNKCNCKTKYADVPKVHVINLIGYAFDSRSQPDYKYFFPMTAAKRAELVSRMRLMWRFAFECARQKLLPNLHLARVGGGWFAKLLDKCPESKYDALLEESLAPVAKEFSDITVSMGAITPQEISAVGDLSQHLWVNAWDAWSMVGNGNAGDDSLDGMFGRHTAMAVLCWPVTNPLLNYQEIIHKEYM